MNKYIKIATTVVLSALSITAIVFLSMIISSKFTTIENLKAINILGSQDKNIAEATRDVWGLFIANITLFAWMAKSWFFMLCCKKGKRKSK